MSLLLIFAASLFGLLLILSFWGMSLYNNLVRLKNQVKNAWTQIDVQLKRRYDLIPNLVETAKGYLKHERETLEAVISARNQAYKASQNIQQSLSPQNTQQVFQADSALTGALSKLMVLVESYPELKGNQNMILLSEELTSTENKVSFARQAYNDTVMTYNTTIATFPDMIFARLLQFNELAYWEITDQDERQAPKVSF